MTSNVRGQSAAVDHPVIFIGDAYGEMSLMLRRHDGGVTLSFGRVKKLAIPAHHAYLLQNQLSDPYDCWYGILQFLGKGRARA